MIKIALSKGRIANNFFITLLNKKIINKSIKYDRELQFFIRNEYVIYLINSNDIVPILEKEKVDLGIIGSDRIEEINDKDIVELLDLNTGVCDFALATLPTTNIQDIKTIASKYPNISKRYLESLKMNCEIVKMNGCLEVAPLMGYADAIIDLVQTGSTLKANGLIELKRFESISTKIITTKDKENNKEIKRLINSLR